MKSFAFSCVFKTDLICWILCAPAMLAPTLDPTPVSHQPISNGSLTQPSRLTHLPSRKMVQALERDEEPTLGPEFRKSLCQGPWKRFWILEDDGPSTHPRSLRHNSA